MSLEAINIKDWKKRINKMKLLSPQGQVTRVIGLTVEVRGISPSIGEVCNILVPGEPVPIRSEVVGFHEQSTLLMPLGELRGISPGCTVIPTGESLTIKVGPYLLGRILDGVGNPMDKGAELCDDCEEISVDNAPPNPLTRKMIEDVLPTGVRAIDGILTCGKGQRIGIFAGSGVGKSTLLGMVARYCSADINVIALVGERGREVREFMEKDLGAEGLAKSVVVVATSEQPALVRLKAPFVASAIAEYFRDQGKDVMLMMDSVTRFAMAQREVGLTVGEPPATRGYTPSVFALLPRLLERSGMGVQGSITAFYTVLVEADDMNDPIADAVRGILDGHIIMSRELAARTHYPAIDIMESVSRLMPDIVTREHFSAAMAIKEKMAVYKQSEDLINIGAYVRGTNPKIDDAINSYEAITNFLKQEMNQGVEFGDTLEQIKMIIN